MKLVDFGDLVKEDKQQDKNFWDWLDGELAERREKYKCEQDEVVRTQKINQSVISPTRKWFYSDLDIGSFLVPSRSMFSYIFPK